jgi:hypothetical protein
MPGLNPIKILGNLKFFSAQLEAAHERFLAAAVGRSRSGQYGDSISAAEKVAVPKAHPAVVHAAEHATSTTRSRATPSARTSRSCMTR